MSVDIVLHQYNGFDFDSMVQLANSSPEEFSKVKARLIDDAIQACRDRDAARRFQFEIDADQIDVCSLDQVAVYFAKCVRSLVELSAANAMDID